MANGEILIRHEVEVEKVVAFLRAKSRNVRFLVDQELADRVLARVERFARENGGHLSIEVLRPRAETLMCGAAFGAGTGAAVGFLIAGPTGAAAGALVGAGAGAALSCARVQFERIADGRMVVSLN